MKIIVIFHPSKNNLFELSLVPVLEIYHRFCIITDFDVRVQIFFTEKTKRRENEAAGLNFENSSKKVTKKISNIFEISN